MKQRYIVLILVTLLLWLAVGCVQPDELTPEPTQIAERPVLATVTAAPTATDSVVDEVDDADEPVEDAVLPQPATDTPAPTETIEPTAVPTEMPTVAPTSTPEPTETPAPDTPVAATDVPTIAPEPEPETEAAADIETETDLEIEILGEIIALSDAAMFTVPNPSSDAAERLGYYVPTQQTARVLGISEDGRWLNVLHPLGFEGWVAMSRFEITDEMAAVLVTAGDVSAETVSAAATLVREPEYVPPATSMVIRANKDAAIFMKANPGASGDRTGYYIPVDEPASALGISENRHWVHVANWGGVQGWVSINFVDFVTGDPWALPVSTFSARGDGAVAAEQPTTTTVIQQQPAPAPQAIQAPPTAVPPTPVPAPTQVPVVEAAVPPTAVPAPTQAPVVVQPTAVPPTLAPVVEVVVPPTDIPPPPTDVPPTDVPPTAVPPTPVPVQPGWAASPTPQGVVVSNPDVEANDLPLSGAIAFWKTIPDVGGAVGDGTWIAEIQVRVPTSFQYSFQLTGLQTVKKTITNQDGDDYYVIRLGQLTCGQPLSSALTVVQNRTSRMQVRNDDTFNEGNIYINAPC